MHDVQFPFFLHDGKNLVEAGALLSLWQMDFWACEIILLYEIGDCCGALAWCVVSVFLQNVKFFIEGGEILSLCNFSLKIRLGIVLLRTHGVQYLFSCKMENSWFRQAECRACAIILEKFLLEAFGIQSFVQMLFGTHAVHCLFYLVMENSWLINWIAYCFARHAWYALFDLFCDRKFVLEAVGILSWCNYSWK